MGSSVKEAGEKSSTLLDSPYLSTPEGIATLLAHMTRRRGWVPSKPVTRNGGTSFLWHIPSTDSPDIKLLEYHVSADHRITYAKWGNFCVESLEYGPKNSFQLNPPSWPQRPINERAAFDPSAMMKLMGAILAIREPRQ
jgi:hypothetical protein